MGDGKGNVGVHVTLRRPATTTVRGVTVRSPSGSVRAVRRYAVRRRRVGYAQRQQVEVSEHERRDGAGTAGRRRRGICGTTDRRTGGQDACREGKGLTQAELGTIIGYSEKPVSSVERGRRAPSGTFLEAVDRLLEAGGLPVALKRDVGLQLRA
ncbi:helix-turn-helix domain-containing protein [Streptomyces sp. NPDC008092]|uniref:helix-turn-helix domain-containing protein n=1 Tax=Streptomyces sp. NPDC008092 TaxID=3364808 RepID=UPI0036F13D0D